MILLLAIAAIVSVVSVAHSAATDNLETAAGESTLLSQEPEDPNANFAVCRTGVATIAVGDQVAWVDDFGAGWHLNFGANSPPATNGAEFVHSIRVKQDKTADGQYLPSYTTTPTLDNAGLGSLIDANPGHLWIVGNEVDRGPDPGLTTVDQGDTMPEMYARAYYDVYHFIKGRDPTAQVANSALVQVTPGRLQYLDIVWDTYYDLYGRSMPVDVWNMHIYILPEVNPQGVPNAIANVANGTDISLARSESYDPDGPGPLSHADSCPLEDVYCFAEHDDMTVFAEQVVGMRRWMQEHGYRNRPLILTEFSILYPYEDDGATCFLQDEFGNCFTKPRVVNFLNNTFNFLETTTDPVLGYPLDGNRLVQQWLWYSVRTIGVGGVSNLVVIQNGSEVMSEVGQAFRTYTHNTLHRYVNLFPEAASNVSVPAPPAGGTVDVELSVWIRNNGNLSPNGGFNVTFYKDSNLQFPIDTAWVPAPQGTDYGLLGCARRAIKVSIPWNDLSPGKHLYWVKVNSGATVPPIPEILPGGGDGTQDNVAQGVVLVGGMQQLLPNVTVSAR